jgi:hypothetical protein
MKKDVLDARTSCTRLRDPRAERATRQAGRRHRDRAVRRGLALRRKACGWNHKYLLGIIGGGD